MNPNPSREHVNRSVTRAAFEKHWGDCEECGLPSLPEGHPLKKPLCKRGQRLYDRAVRVGGIKLPVVPAAPTATADAPALDMKLEGTDK